MNDVFNDKKRGGISHPIKQDRNMNSRFARRLLPKQPMPYIKKKNTRNSIRAHLCNMSRTFAKSK